MARPYGVEKLNLLWLLALLAELEGERYGDLVRLVSETAACSERTAKDALSILRQSGHVSAVADTDDRRCRGYLLTEQGRQRLTDPQAEILCFARKLFTRCPSPAVRRWRDHQIETAGAARARLKQLERSLANPPTVSFRL